MASGLSIQYMISATGSSSSGKQYIMPCPGATSERCLQGMLNAMSRRHRHCLVAAGEGGGAVTPSSHRSAIQLDAALCQRASEVNKAWGG